MLHFFKFFPISEKFKMHSSTTTKKNRKTAVWTKLVPKDANGNVIIADECLKLHVGGDLSQRGEPRSGKTYYRCKYVIRFSCGHEVRSSKSEVTGETVLEECGEHDHSPSTETDGVPNRCKELMNKSFKLHHKFLPSDMCNHIEEEFDVMLSPESTSKVKSYIS